MEISFGKLALYTAGGGINPKRTIAVSLDVGTDNEQLLQDPFYVGNRHARRRGADYDAFIQQYVETANRLFPQAMLHFEDFGAANARAILDKYASDYCVFNDDVQGTGTVVMAALYAALRVSGISMRDLLHHSRQVPPSARQAHRRRGLTAGLGRRDRRRTMAIRHRGHQTTQPMIIGSRHGIRGDCR
jgi:Malic enzyme, N-terminal domain